MLHDYLQLGFLSIGLRSIQATKLTGSLLLSGLSHTAGRQKNQFYPDSTEDELHEIAYPVCLQKIYISCKHTHCLLKAFLRLKNTIPLEGIVCCVAPQTVGLLKSRF